MAINETSIAKEYNYNSRTVKNRAKVFAVIHDRTGLEKDSNETPLPHVFTQFNHSVHTLQTMRLTKSTKQVRKYLLNMHITMNKKLF